MDIAAEHYAKSKLFSNSHILFNFYCADSIYSSYQEEIVKLVKFVEQNSGNAIYIWPLEPTRF